jgi:hypothetical protein
MICLNSTIPRAHYMRIQRLITLTLSSSLVLSATTMAADSITIEPGMWEVTTKMTSPMSPQPRVETSKECMKDASISPDDLAPNDGDGCSITESDISGNAMNWSMQCTSPGGVMTGGGNFTSNGDSGHGSMTMNMKIEGQSFDMQMEWQGKRIGSC